jgi:hypothetical protein
MGRSTSDIEIARQSIVNSLDETPEDVEQAWCTSERMDKCTSLFQCSERLLAGWGTREGDLLDGDRSSGSVRYRLLGL